MEQKQLATTAALRRRSSNSKSPDLVHLGYSMHVAAANGDKRRVKRCLKAGIGLLELLDLRVQVAQLSQKDRAAGWVSFGQKWKTVTGRQYFADIIIQPF